MKKLKSLKELETQRLLEIERCKTDIVYFVENYVTPKIPLTESQKFMLRALNEGRVHLVTGRGHSRYFIATSVERHEEFKKEN
jgi:hypothetical protein